MTTRPSDLNVERSALSVERSGAAGRGSASAAAVDRDHPWPGLASYTEEQSGLFFGRDEEIRALARLMERKALTVLFGQSGLGKSSLLQAGVFPRLRAANFCPIYIRLDHAEGAPPPAEQVKAMVAATTAQLGTWTKPGSAKPGESLWEFFHHRDDRLVANAESRGRGARAAESGANAARAPRPQVNTAPTAAGHKIVPVLVFDQFEELFTLGAATPSTGSGSTGAQRDRAVAFMSELAELVENRPAEKLVERLDQSSEEMEAFDFSRTDYRVCISLREDYLPHLEGLKTIMPALMENRMRLTQMTGTQALDAVRKPGGALVTDEVARTIVEFVAGARGGSVERLAELQVEPPLLSVICRELNERRRKLGQAQITADLVTGNRREILTDFYERSVGDLPEEMRRFVEDKLLTKSGFRDNLALETALEEPGVSRPLIDTLVARRLLRIEDRIGSQRVELTHDVLADVVRASRDARQQRLALEQAAAREQQALAAAARRTRRMRFAIIGLSLAVVALGVGAVFGIRAQVGAKQQASHNDFLLGSRLVDEGRVSDGVAHLVRSARKDSGNDVIASRLLSILASQNFAFPSGAPLALPSPAEFALHSPDGKEVVCLGRDGIIRTIDAETWRLGREWKLPGLVEGVAVVRATRQFGLHADERFERFAVKLRDGGLVVCDRTGAPLGGAIRPPDARAIGFFALSPDGRWLGGTDDATLWIWEAQTGELKATLPHNGLFRFSPDSRKVATLQRVQTVGTDGTSRSGSKVYRLPEGTQAGADITYVHGQSRGRFFSRDSERLFVLHANGVQAYDIASGKPVGPLLRNLVGGDYASMLSPDGSRIVLAGQKAVVIEAATGAMVFPPFEHGGAIREVGFSRDGRTLFTNANDGLFRLWDLETGRLLGTPMHRQDQFTPAALSPDGRQVTVFTAAGPVTRMQFRRQTATALALPLRGVRNSSFVPGAPAGVIWFKRAEAQVLEIATGQPIARVPLTVAVAGTFRFRGTAEPGDAYFGFAAETGISAVIMGDRQPARNVVLEGSAAFRFNGTLAPGRHHVARFDPSDRITVTLFELKTGRRVAAINLEERNGGVLASAQSYPFSADDSRIGLQTSDGVLHVHEVLGGRQLFSIEPSGRTQFSVLRFLADGRLLTGGMEGHVRTWDSSGRPLQEIPAHRGAIVRIDASRDLRLIATLSDDSTVQVWEAATLRRVCSVPADFGINARVEFSADGTRLIAPWRSGARVWDVRTGQPVTEGLEHEGAQTLQYGPDGRFVSTTTGENAPDSEQRIWAVPPRAAGRPTPDWLLTLASVAAGQRLTDSGELVPATEEIAQLEEVRRTVRGLPASDPFAEWAQWILSEDANRPIAPGFKVTPAEAQTLRDELSRQQPVAAEATVP